MLAPSTRIGRYEIKSALGKGGMGSLYVARDPNTDRLVAIKLLAAHLDSDDLKARFDLETKALASLNHPNIVDIYDSGQYRGSPFIVMEYVRGETIEEMIRRSAAISLSRKLKLIAQLCGGLSHAHEAGVIHRDIKPANLMVEDRSQRLKIVDFGIARVTEGLTRFGRMTKVNMQIGTPGYMSPEQIEGGPIDHRSDLFAVGVVLYELLSNHAPFTGDNTRQIERKVLGEQPPPLDTLVADLDPAIQAIVDRALQKDAANRFQTGTEFADALDGVLERLPKTDAGARPMVTPSPGGKQSPAPVGKGSKAEIAYQRGRDAYVEGAVEAAKRFAIEALVEDPGHEPARAFLKKVDPKRWVPPPPAPSRGRVPSTQMGRDPGSPKTELGDMDALDPTMVSTRASDLGVWAPPSPPSSPSDGDAETWDPYARTIVVRPGKPTLGAEDWGGGPPSRDRLDPTLLIPSADKSPADWEDAGDAGDPGKESQTWDPYSQTIVGPAPPSPRRSSGPKRIAAQRRPFPWKVVGLGVGAVAVVALAVAATWFALFREENGFRLIIEKPQGGTISTDRLICGTAGDACSATLELSSEVEFQVTADPDFKFVGFTGDCAPGGRARMTGPKSCGATFEKLPPAPEVSTATLTVSRATGGTVIGSGIKCGTDGNDCSVQHPVGTVVALTAKADDGYRFRGFTGCGKGTTYSATLNGPVTCFAQFDKPPVGPAPGTTAANSPPVEHPAPVVRPPGVGEGNNPSAAPAGGASNASPAGAGSTSSGGGAAAAGGTSDEGRASGGNTEKTSPVEPPLSDEKYFEIRKKELEEAAKKAEEQAKKDIDGTLAAFREAMEALDIDALRRVYPSIDTRGYQASFKDTESLAYSYSGPPKFKNLDPAAGRAQLEVESKRVGKMKVGAPNEGEFVETFTMFKSGDNWLIQERKPPRPKKK